MWPGQVSVRTVKQLVMKREEIWLWLHRKHRHISCLFFTSAVVLLETFLNMHVLELAMHVEPYSFPSNRLNITRVSSYMILVV